MYSNIVNVNELHGLLNSENLIILDARTGKDAHINYLEKHIKGALFIDLEKDLATIPDDPKHGGRHPLPEISNFAKTITDLGISEDSSIIIYDDKNGANAAARCWWMLKSFNINNVKILNGGLQAAENEGITTRSGKEITKKSKINTPNKWQLPLVQIYDVEKAINEQSAYIIDVREAYRYNGESEPIDKTAGHIPDAINIPYTENLGEEGLFLTPEKLKEKYGILIKDKSKNIIVHCGSGVTACHTILALTEAGFQNIKLYIGSWSEWSRSGKLIIK